MITNLVNGKIYVGKHQAKDLNDGYMGSGKHLKASIIKHGIENFKKEILFQFDNEADMNAKEAELVTEEFCLREDTYNLCPGGKGGWGYINANGLGVSENQKASARILARKQASKAASASGKSQFEKRVGIFDPNRPNGFLGKAHSDSTKSRIGLANARMKGSLNSQFGTMWITNGQENKKIKKDVDIIPEGWYKGRK